MDRQRYRHGVRECVLASDEIGWDCFGDDADDEEDADFWSRRRLAWGAPLPGDRPTNPPS
jgi:hypothetical protein